MESFIKTLKYVEVYLREYENLIGARACIGRFLQQVYHHKRLHSALGYGPPAEFEQAYRQHNQPTAPELTVSRTVCTRFLWPLDILEQVVYT